MKLRRTGREPGKVAYPYAEPTDDDPECSDSEDEHAIDWHIKREQARELMFWNYNTRLKQKISFVMFADVDEHNKIEALRDNDIIY